MTDPIDIPDAEPVTGAVQSVAVPTRHVDSDGTAIIVGKLTDADGNVGTITVTYTADHALVCMVDGLQLNNFNAWSTS